MSPDSVEEIQLVLQKLQEHSSRSFSRVACSVWGHPPIVSEGVRQEESRPVGEALLTSDQLWAWSLDLLGGRSSMLNLGATGGVIVAVVQPGVALVGQLRCASALGVGRVLLRKAVDQIRPLLSSERR